MNALLTIWFQPRKTFRYLIDNYDPIAVWMLAILGGIKESLNWTNICKMGERHDLDFISLVVLVVGPIFGIGANWIAAFFTGWVGRRFKGKASTQGLWNVFIWATLPVILLMPFWLLWIWIFGAGAFSPNLSILVNHSGSIGLILLYYGYLFLKLFAAIWSFIFCLVGVSEAQGFTKWNAFANTFVSGILTYLVIGFPLYFIFRL